MSATDAPIRKHRNWRYLLRAAIQAHPGLRAATGDRLSMVLQPAASIAWWLATLGPEELLSRDKLHIAIAGAGPLECADSGRWLSFIPWMLGMPHLQLDITLIGDEILSAGEGSLAGFGHLNLQSALRHDTPLKQYVAGRPTAAIFNGTLGKWRKGPGLNAPVDLCVLFAPGFTSHGESWLTEDELLPFLRNKAPIAIFGYSKIDSLEDQYLLRLLGVNLVPAEPVPSPWTVEHEMSETVGSFAGVAWAMEVTDTDFVVDFENPEAVEFLELQDYARVDCEDYGADVAMERMGVRWPVTNPDSETADAVIVLAREDAYIESTGELGKLFEEGFTSFNPRIIVPEELRSARPAGGDLIARAHWALRVHRDWVEPTLAKVASGPSSMDSDGFQEAMRNMMSDLGLEGNPDEFLDRLRAQGGVHGPTHPAWHDLLDNLNWQLDDYSANPARFEAAFWAHAPNHNIVLPVVCEAYAYMPDDAGDQLAQQAMAEVSQAYPDGALLLFKTMPYREISGHKYHFGGMLWWGQTWSPFAFNESISGPDDIIDQIAAGFRFDAVDPKFADDSCDITVPFNRMCYRLDPNEPGPMQGLRSSGGWVTLIPSGSLP